MPSPTDEMSAACRVWAQEHPESRRWARFTSWHDGGSVFEVMDFRAPLAKSKAVFHDEAGMKRALEALEAAVRAFDAAVADANRTRSRLSP